MGPVRVWVISLAGDGFRFVTVVSFRPLGSVRVVTVALGSFLASLFMAAFWAAMAVCFFVVKPAVANPGSTFSPNMLLRTALVREAAGGGEGGRVRVFQLSRMYVAFLSTFLSHSLLFFFVLPPPLPSSAAFFFLPSFHFSSTAHIHTHTSAGVMFRQKFLQWFPSSSDSNHDGAPQDPHQTELLRFSKLQVGREELEVDRQTHRWMNRETHRVVRS